ncbi:unnamed protein product [Cuscuta campestris]|uniref:Uncharacterized protein n=1 Tax=Cuscuta campestris TaxID=132261 RepID=A0A484K527_9ASTE|nr:unnamed protein product [Cuscuta campestris]
MCDEDLLVGKTGVKVRCFCNVWVGAKIVEGVVSDADLVELKESAFGDFFNLGGIKWFTGQLMILLALNYVEPLQRSGCVDSLKFHIGDKVVEFKKTDFALITGLKFGKETMFEGIDMDEPNDISLRYFGGKMSVTRLDVEHVFKNIRVIGCRKPMDVVKLAMLYLLCCHVVGNQGRTKIPALYMHLVNDVKRFNDFEWGEHLWTDLVESMGRCSSILNTRGNGRFTFPGFLFPLQIWSFETFPRLMENGICAIGKGTGSLWPRALRWETSVRPKHDVLENSIFGKPGESVIWKEMVAKPMERVMGNIETLLSVGGAGNRSSSNAFGEEVNEGYGAGRRSLKGKLHWGPVTACCDGVQNEDGVGVKSHVVKKKARVKRTEKGTENADMRTRKERPSVVEEVIGASGGDNEPSLRDVLTAIVHMEKRHSKLRVEVTKLRIALNAQSRLLKRVLLGTKMAKRQQKKKGDKREENGLPSFDLGIESQGGRDEPGNDQEDMIYEEDIIKDADLGTQLGVSDNEVEDPLNDVSTQEVEGRWRQTIEGLGLNLDSGKGAGSSKSIKVSKETTTEYVHIDERVVDERADVVDRIDVAELVGASTSNGVCAGVPETVNGTVTGAMVGGFCDRFETVSQIVEDLQDCPPSQLFFSLEGNLVGGVEDTKVQEVTLEKIFSENVRPVDEEIVDDGADEEMVNEEPCTQIVVYEEPIRVEIPREIKDCQKRPLKCPQRFSPDQLIVRRKRKKVRTVMEHVIDFGGDGDDFMGPFTLDPAEMPGEDDLREVDEFMHKGLLKKHKKEPGRKYCVNEDVLAPSEFKTHYDEKATLTKSWYYEIYFPWGWLSDTHLDVIFYYLRMNGVEFGLVQRTYDSSLRRSDSKRKLQQFMPSLQMFLPKLMDKLGVYEGREEGPIGDGVLAIEGGSCCPQQNDGSSCGMFVVKMAEFLMMGRDVRDMGDDEIAAYRKKMTTELLAYSGK